MEDNSPQFQPYMEIVVQPQSKFRFRYKSEMTGKHGSLLGVMSTPSKSTIVEEQPGTSSSSSGIQSKLFPSVKVSKTNANAFSKYVRGFC